MTPLKVFFFFYNIIKFFYFLKDNSELSSLLEDAKRIKLDSDALS